MATVAQVAKASLQRILVQGSEADFEPDEFADFIFDLNTYMLALDAEGIQLGYTEVSNLGDEVTVPTGALRGIIANMAIEVSPDYNGEITAGLIKAADEGMNAMRQLGQHIGATEFPSTLPIGSGNEDGGAGFQSHHFYPDLEAEILAETTGCISLEVGTVNAIADEPVCPVINSFITVTAALETFVALPSETSPEQSYVVSGTNLTEGILIQAPINFQISATSGTGFGATLTVGAGPTTIYVQFSSGTSGVFSNDIVHSSAGASTENLAVIGDTEDDFVMVFTTTIPSENFTIFCQDVGVFNASIDWGDGTQTAVVAFNDAGLSHVYAEAADYTVRISGVFPNIFFNFGSSALKVKEIIRFGLTGFLDMTSAFGGCENLIQANVAGGVQDFSVVSNFDSMFDGCFSLVTLDVSGWDVSAGNDFVAMFFDCAAIVTLDVSGWDVGLGADLEGMFFNCTSLVTLDVSGWDVSANSDFSNMFAGCTSLVTLDVSGWDVSAGTFFGNTFSGCVALPDIIIDGWNIVNMTSATGFLSGVTLPTSRYDATLIAWEAQAVQSSVIISFGNSQFTSGGAAETARTDLVNNDLWTITDGGAAP